MLQGGPGPPEDPTVECLGVGDSYSHVTTLREAAVISMYGQVWIKPFQGRAKEVTT